MSKRFQAKPDYEEAALQSSGNTCRNEYKHCSYSSQKTDFSEAARIFHLKINQSTHNRSSQEYSRDRIGTRSEPGSLTTILTKLHQSWDLSE